MKKSIKFMALGLAIIPCALMLTGCGEKDKRENIVNISGDYQTVEGEEFDAVVAEMDNGFNIEEISKGLRAVIYLDANANMGAMGKMSLNYEMDNIVKGNPSNGELNLNDIELYSKVTAKSKLTGSQMNMDLQGTVKQYMLDGNQYLDLTGARDVIDMMGAGQEFPSLKMSQKIAGIDETSLVIPDYTVSQLLDMIPYGDWGEYVKISKSETDTGYKIKVVFPKATLNELVDNENLEEVDFNFTSDAEFYMIYENNEFSGLYLNANVNIILNATALDMADMTGLSQIVIKTSLNAQVIGYEGEISFPSDLSSYTSSEE